MDPATNGHDRTHLEEDVLPTGWRWSLPRALGMAAFLFLVVFWIWAFANRDSIAHPDTFDDPVFSQAAEAICAPRQAAIRDLPLAVVTNNPVERGLLVEQGTAELERMVAELSALAPPTDPKGADGVVQWLDDYELFLNDRRGWTDQLAEGQDEPFYVSANPSGVRVVDLLRTFAEVNTMDSCAPSGDA